ncbi:hypothetical protein QM996_09635 [Sinorhizobium chiapasense]
MADANEDIAQKKLPGRALFLRAVLLFSAAALPIFARIFGHQFLPSIEWAARTNIPGIATGLIFGVTFLWIACRSNYRVQGSALKRAVAFVGSPLIGYVVGSSLVVLAGPMVLASIAGHQVELLFTVEDVPRHGYGGCRSVIELHDLPMLFNSLCSVPDDFRRGLEPGDRILLIGRGTSLGLYVERLRRTD